MSFSPEMIRYGIIHEVSNDSIEGQCRVQVFVRIEKDVRSVWVKEKKAKKLGTGTFVALGLPGELQAVTPKELKKLGVDQDDISEAYGYWKQARKVRD